MPRVYPVLAVLPALLLPVRVVLEDVVLGLSAQLAGLKGLGQPEASLQLKALVGMVTSAVEVPGALESEETMRVIEVARASTRKDIEPSSVLLRCLPENGLDW